MANQLEKLIRKLRNKPLNVLDDALDSPYINRPISTALGLGIVNSITGIPIDRLLPFSGAFLAGGLSIQAIQDIIKKVKKK